MENKKINIAVLSGKGGTGKTLLSVNLAHVAGDSTYIDCDVEEPNGHLFFNANNIRETDVNVKIPVVNKDLCIGCRACVEFCKFNALAFLNKEVLVFEDICHSCGACSLLCKTGAISEKDKKIGSIITGDSEKVKVATGMLNIGESSGVAIVSELFNYTNSEINIIDCPPGSACIVMESIKDADYCLLVAEPTVFGAHNLAMVDELVSVFDKKYGVVLNKCIGGENPSKAYCRNKDIKIIGEIEFDYELGLLNSNSKIVAREEEKYFTIFEKILDNILGEIKDETIIDPQW